MNRIEIETKLNTDRAWLLETYAKLSLEDLARGATPSEHDAANMWSALDHLAHLSLIEFNFERMVRRWMEGAANPVGLMKDDAGRERSREEIMASVHAMTEEWQVKHGAKPLAAIVALGQESRAVTLKLLSELSDEQIAATLPGAPWADGTVGGVLAANADHGRMHWHWVKEGFAAQGLASPA